MNNSIFSIMRRIALAALLGLGALAAHADIVKYTFTVNTDSGPLGVQSFTGSFSFNAPSIPASGDAQFDLTTFAFKFAGPTPLALDSLLFGSAIFSDGVFMGLDAVSTSANFSFTPEDAFSPASFGYTIGGDSGFGDFTAKLVTDEPQGNVPEPESLALMLTGLGLLGWTRRNRCAKLAGIAAA